MSNPIEVKIDLEYILTELEKRALRPRLLSVREAGRYLGRSERGMRYLIANGELPHIRADNRIFLDLRDLDRWIEVNKINS